MSQHRAHWTPAVLLALSLASCGGGDEPSTAGGAADAPPEVEGRELAGDDFVGIEEQNVAFNLHWSDGPVTREPTRLAPPVNEIQEVTTVEGDGFDRVIFRLGEGQIPGYELAWAEEPPAGCGGDAPVSVEGESHLRVRLRSANTAAGVVESAEPGYENLRALASTCVREGDAVWHFGVRQQAQVRVMEMHSPRRLVVDVRHP